MIYLELFLGFLKVGCFAFGALTQLSAYPRCCFIIRMADRRSTYLHDRR